MSTVSIGTSYKFTLVNNAYVGTEQIGKLISNCDFEMASLVMDVSQLHVNIYPSLPAGVNRDPKQLEYYIVQTSDNAKIAIAKQWLAKDPEVIGKITRQYTMDFKTNAERINFEQMVADYGFKITSSV